MSNVQRPMLNAESEFDVECSAFSVGCFLRSQERELQDRHLVPEGDFNVARGLDHFAIWWNEAQPVHGIGDGDMAHLIILVTDHRSKMSFVGELDRFDSKARAENAIERGRRSAAL